MFTLNNHWIVVISLEISIQCYFGWILRALQICSLWSHIILSPHIPSFVYICHISYHSVWVNCIVYNIIYTAIGVFIGLDSATVTFHSQDGDQSDRIMSIPQREILNIALIYSKWQFCLKFEGREYLIDCYCIVTDVKQRYCVVTRCDAVVTVGDVSCYSCQVIRVLFGLRFHGQICPEWCAVCRVTEVLDGLKLASSKDLCSVFGVLPPLLSLSLLRRLP